MRISASKWFLIFIYLIISLSIGIFIASATTLILINLLNFLFLQTPMDMSSIDYLKILKGSIAGGIFAAMGSLWLNFQHYRKSRRSR